MAYHPRVSHDAPPPYIEEVAPSTAIPLTAVPKPEEELPEYSRQPSSGVAVKRSNAIPRNYLIALGLLVLIVGGIATAVGVMVRKKNDNIHHTSSSYVPVPSAIPTMSALAACECEMGVFTITQYNTEDLYFSGKVRDETGWQSSQLPQILIDFPASWFGSQIPAAQTNLTAVCRVDTDDNLFVHIFYFAKTSIYVLNEAVLRLPRFKTLAVLPGSIAYYNQTRIADFDAPSSISAIHNSGLGIKLYYIENRSPNAAIGTSVGISELTWTNLTGWSSPIHVYQAYAEESTSALTAATVDASKVKLQSNSSLDNNDIVDQIYLFYTNIDGSVTSKVWIGGQTNLTTDSGGWSMASQLRSNPAYFNATHTYQPRNIRSLAAVIPSLNPPTPQLYIISSDRIQQIIIRANTTFDYVSLETLPAVSTRPYLLAAVSDTSAHDSLISYSDKNLETALQTHIFYKPYSDASSKVRYCEVSHYVTNETSIAGSSGPVMNVEYVNVTLPKQ